jgi:Ca-activated chloride channel family protein
LKKSLQQSVTSFQLGARKGAGFLPLADSRLTIFDCRPKVRLVDGLPIERRIENRQSKIENPPVPYCCIYNFPIMACIFAYQMRRGAILAVLLLPFVASGPELNPAQDAGTGLPSGLPSAHREAHNAGPAAGSAGFASVPADEGRRPDKTQASTTLLTQAGSQQPAVASTIKVEVDLVPVEVSVRDPRGRPLENLTRDDFRVLEDGVEQNVRYFSHADLPLALALVVDSSTSVAASLVDLRQGAVETLSLLKPDDQVALFSFTDKPELEHGLTTDRKALAEDIAAIMPGGGTDINDALYLAAEYLGLAAPGRRHAIVLVSDNEPSDKGQHDDSQVIRAALDSATMIYSIKVGYFEHSRWYFLTHSESELGSVEKVCRETGGTVLDSRNSGSVTSALATLIAWLKEGYSLAYSSTNPRQDGTYRKIEVRLGGRYNNHKYFVFARQGYFAPKL